MDGHEGNGTDEQVAGSRENGAAVQTGTEEPREEEPAKMKSRWADESIDMDSPGFDPIIGNEPVDDMSLNYEASIAFGSLSAIDSFSGRRPAMGCGQVDQWKAGCSLYVCNPEPHLTREDLIRFFHPLRICTVEFCPDGRALVVFERLEDCRHGLQAYQRRRPERGGRELFLTPAGNALMDHRFDWKDQRRGGAGCMSGELGSSSRMGSMRNRERGPLMMIPPGPFDPARRMMPEPPPDDRHAVWDPQHSSPHPVPPTRTNRRKSPDFGDIRREPSRSILEPPPPPQKTKGVVTAPASMERPRLNIRSQARILEESHGVARDPKIFGDTHVAEPTKAERILPGMAEVDASDGQHFGDHSNEEAPSPEAAPQTASLKKMTSRDIFGSGKPQDVFEYERRRQADATQRSNNDLLDEADGSRDSPCVPATTGRRESSGAKIVPPVESSDGSVSRNDSVVIDQERSGGESDSVLSCGQKPLHVEGVQTMSTKDIEREVTAVSDVMKTSSENARRVSPNIFGGGKPQDDTLYQKRKELERQQADPSRGILGPAPAAASAAGPLVNLEGHLDSVEPVKTGEIIRSCGGGHHDEQYFSDPFARRCSYDAERVVGCRQGGEPESVQQHSFERKEMQTQMGEKVMVRGGPHSIDQMNVPNNASGQRLRRKATAEEVDVDARSSKQHSVAVEAVEAASLNGSKQQHSGEGQQVPLAPGETFLTHNSMAGSGGHHDNHIGSQPTAAHTPIVPLLDTKSDFPPCGGWGAHGNRAESIRRAEGRVWQEFHLDATKVQQGGAYDRVTQEGSGRLVEVYRASEGEAWVNQADIMHQRGGEHIRGETVGGRVRRDDKKKKQSVEGGRGTSRRYNEEEDESGRFRGNFRHRGGVAPHGGRESRWQNREDKREDSEYRGGTSASSEPPHLTGRVPVVADLAAREDFQGDDIHGDVGVSAEDWSGPDGQVTYAVEEDLPRSISGHYDNYKGSSTPRGFRWEPTGGRGGTLSGRGRRLMGAMENAGGRRGMLDDGTVDGRERGGTREGRHSPRYHQGSSAVRGSEQRPVNRDPPGRLGSRGRRGGGDGLYRRRETLPGRGEGGVPLSTDVVQSAPTIHPEKNTAPSPEIKDSEQKPAFPSIPRRAILGHISPAKVQTKNRFATLDSSEDDSN
eukprot:GHVS01011956.1.p1 GENE.GHVS01011956.1~~GHVS01011956.1.p1  ORF type:complete len:1152 (+),score=170.60 GHVS01011956.1:186-3641(+)